jgi:hypothetical protein
MLAALAGCGLDNAEGPVAASLEPRAEEPAVVQVKQTPEEEAAAPAPSRNVPSVELLDELVTELDALTSEHAPNPSSPPPAASAEEPESIPLWYEGLVPANGPTTILVRRAPPPPGGDAAPLPPAAGEDRWETQPPTTAEGTLAADVAALRAEVRDLRQTVDARVGSLVLELRAENRRLREEVMRLRGGGMEDPAMADYVPRPGNRAFEEALARARGTAPGQIPTALDGAEAAPDGGVPLSQVLDELRTEGEADPQTLDMEGVAEVPESIGVPQASDSEPPLRFLPEGYAVIREWGRTPKDAEALGADASSLRGMILVAPPSQSDQELMALGRQLRADSNGYANVNIEVFDSEEAARQFIETSQAPPERRVLQVSRHQAFGLDAIFLWRHGLAIDVPLEE